MFDIYVVMKGTVSQEYEEMSSIAFNSRQKCDYEVYAELNKSEAEETIISPENSSKYRSYRGRQRIKELVCRVKDANSRLAKFIAL